MQNIKIIAIDGPAGSGKSTIAKRLSKELGYDYLDTGAMYRTIAFAGIFEKVFENTEKIIEIAKEGDFYWEFQFGEFGAFYKGVNITDKIRTPEVNNYVSKVAAIKEVRDILVEKQREYAETNRVVAEGRDVGSVVFPNADIKFYFVADTDERANRRFKELTENNNSVSYEEVKSNIINRDTVDSTRKESPLIKPENAIEIDTTKLSKEEVFNKVLQYIKGPELTK